MRNARVLVVCWAALLVWLPPTEGQESPRAEPVSLAEVMDLLLPAEEVGGYIIIGAPEERLPLAPVGGAPEARVYNALRAFECDATLIDGLWIVDARSGRASAYSALLADLAESIRPTLRANGPGNELSEGLHALLRSEPVAMPKSPRAYTIARRKLPLDSALGRQWLEATRAAALHGLTDIARLLPVCGARLRIDEQRCVRVDSPSDAARGHWVPYLFGCGDPGAYSESEMGLFRGRDRDRRYGPRLTTPVSMAAAGRWGDCLPTLARASGVGVAAAPELADEPTIIRLNQVPADLCLAAVGALSAREVGLVDLASGVELTAVPTRWERYLATQPVDARLAAVLPYHTIGPRALAGALPRDVVEAVDGGGTVLDETRLGALHLVRRLVASQALQEQRRMLAEETDLRVVYQVGPDGWAMAHREYGSRMRVQLVPTGMFWFDLTPEACQALEEGFFDAPHRLTTGSRRVVRWTLGRHGVPLLQPVELSGQWVAERGPIDAP